MVSSRSKTGGCTNVASAARGFRAVGGRRVHRIAADGKHRALLWQASRADGRVWRRGHWRCFLFVYLLLFLGLLLLLLLFRRKRSNEEEEEEEEEQTGSSEESRGGGVQSR